MYENYLAVSLKIVFQYNQMYNVIITNVLLFLCFQVAWYNTLVQPIFRINYNEDTIAFLVISNPRMFENAFIPFIRNQADVLNNLNDPIDQCMIYYLSKVSEVN